MSKSFLLRPFREEDVPSLAHYANNLKIARFMTNRFPHPYTEEDARAFIKLAMSHEPTKIFTIDIDGKASGGVGLFQQEDVHCKNAELGYWVAEPFWGKGIVSAAILEMIDYGFNTFDIDRIYAVPFGPNTASQRVLEKTGFKLEARFEKTIFKHGEQLDELVYAIRKNV